MINSRLTLAERLAEVVAKNMPVNSTNHPSERLSVECGSESGNSIQSPVSDRSCNTKSSAHGSGYWSYLSLFNQSDSGSERSGKVAHADRRDQEHCRLSSESASYEFPLTEATTSDSLSNNRFLAYARLASTPNGSAFIETESIHRVSEEVKRLSCVEFFDSEHFHPGILYDSDSAEPNSTIADSDSISRSLTSSTNITLPQHAGALMSEAMHQNPDVIEQKRKNFEVARDKYIDYEVRLQSTLQRLNTKFNDLAVHDQNTIDSERLPLKKATKQAKLELFIAQHHEAVKMGEKNSKFEHWHSPFHILYYSWKMEKKARKAQLLQPNEAGPLKYEFKRMTSWLFRSPKKTNLTTAPDLTPATVSNLNGMHDLPRNAIAIQEPNIHQREQPLATAQSETREAIDTSIQKNARINQQSLAKQTLSRNFSLRTTRAAWSTKEADGKKQRLSVEPLSTELSTQKSVPKEHPMSRRLSTQLSETKREDQYFDLSAKSNNRSLQRMANQKEKTEEKLLKQDEVKPVISPNNSSGEPSSHSSVSMGAKISTFVSSLGRFGSKKTENPEVSAQTFPRDLRLMNFDLPEIEKSDFSDFKDLISTWEKNSILTGTQ